MSVNVAVSLRGTPSHIPYTIGLSSPILVLKVSTSILVSLPSCIVPTTLIPNSRGASAMEGAVDAWNRRFCRYGGSPGQWLPRFVRCRKCLNVAPTRALSFSSPVENVAKVSKTRTGFCIFCTASLRKSDAGYGGSSGSPFASFVHKPQYIRFFAVLPPKRSTRSCAINNGLSLSRYNTSAPACAISLHQCITRVDLPEPGLPVMRTSAPFGITGSMRYLMSCRSNDSGGWLRINAKVSSIDALDSAFGFRLRTKANVSGFTMSAR